MAEIAQRHKEKLKYIKDCVKEAREYFQDNVERFHICKKFVFESSLSIADRNALEEMQKPTIEFNVLEAYISRLRGEFSKQEPSITVRAINDNVDIPTLKLVENVMRGILFDANNNSFENDVYNDILGGGFSVMKVWTEYESINSFNQVMKIGRVYDPTMCGFDPLARLSHKGDGQFCFEIYPKSRDEFEEEYPDVDTSTLKFTRTFGDFNWSFKNRNKEVILVCDFYLKKRKKKKVYLLADGKSYDQEAYNKLQEAFALQIKQPPAILKEESRLQEYICRYRVIENEVLEYIETDFKYLPLVFVDGNSQLLQDGGNSMRQYTRPYIYHAMGAQRFKNYAGQTWANEIENMVQHKWIIAIEGIPEQYIDAYTNSQQPSTIIYRAYFPGKDGLPIPPPQAVVRPPMPPEIMQAFQVADQTIQTTLGSYDAQQGITDSQLSGVAIVEGATQSNACAMPYIMGFLAGLNQIAQIILDLIPKYYVTPRTIPTVDAQGRRFYIRINDPNQPSLSMAYAGDALEVRVEPGLNFEIQKNKALQVMTGLMSATPSFAQLMDQGGLPILIDNLDIRGADELKLLAEQQMQRQQQQAQQGPPPNPQMMAAQLKGQELQQRAQHDRATLQLKAQELQQKQQQDMINAQLQMKELRQKDAEIMLDAKEQHEDAIVQIMKARSEDHKADAQLALSAAELAHKHADLIHRHAKESIETVHMIHETNKPKEKDNGKR